jgi:hypothetical protein
MTDSGSARPLPPARPVRHADLGASLGDDPLRRYTVADCSVICRRSPKTIANLLSKHQLPRRTSWVIRNRHRQRAISVTATVAEWLMQITFLGDREALKRPPR